MPTTSIRWESWRANEVAGDIREKVARALNETAADGVRYAQEIAPRRTGFYANTIETVQDATPQRLVVTWGNVTASYAIWIEIGARGRPGRYIIRRSLEAAGPGLVKRLGA